MDPPLSVWEDTMSKNVKNNDRTANDTPTREEVTAVSTLAAA